LILELASTSPTVREPVAKSRFWPSAYSEIMRWASAEAVGDTGRRPDDRPKLTMVVRSPIATRLRVLALSHPILVRKIIVSHVNAKDLYFLRFLVLQTGEREHAYVTALSGRSQFGELWKKQQASPLSGVGVIRESQRLLGAMGACRECG
jgi:hypothetical protein